MEETGLFVPHASFLPCVRVRPLKPTLGDQVVYLLSVCGRAWATFGAVSLLGLQGALASQHRGDAHSPGCCGRYCYRAPQLMAEECSMRRVDLGRIHTLSRTDSCAAYGYLWTCNILL